MTIELPVSLAGARFFLTNDPRQVNCPEDIAPVEADYQRYKMIKRKLAQLTET